MASKRQYIDDEGEVRPGREDAAKDRKRVVEKFRGLVGELSIDELDELDDDESFSPAFEKFSSRRR